MFDPLAQPIHYQTLDYRGVQLTIKRLDQIHPNISGNKFFKLKYNFLAAKDQGCTHVLTFGGAFSNHIAATAYAAHYFGFKSIGIIRGEELAHRPLNATLQTAQRLGMQLYFVSREQYRQKQHSQIVAQILAASTNTYLIPEGGSNNLAVAGCREILSVDDQNNFDIICAPVGTGGTLAGLIEASHAAQQVLGFSALKGDFLQKDIQQWTQKTNWSITDRFCEGGYAKTSPALLAFITHIEQQYQLPLEQVYTAKMLRGVMSLIDEGYFSPDQRILLIHTGGLQGRIS